jgi:hypothetical protein
MVPTQSRADWQYSRWGQSLESLLAEAGGKASKTTAEEEGHSIEALGRAMATTRHNAAGIETPVYFLFKDGALSAVTLAVRDRYDAKSMLEGLMARYGKPVADTTDSGDYCEKSNKFWQDKAEGNDVRYVAVDCGDLLSDFSIRYSRHMDKAASGL